MPLSDEPSAGQNSEEALAEAKVARLMIIPGVDVAAGISIMAAVGNFSQGPSTRSLAGAAE